MKSLFSLLWLTFVLSSFDLQALKQQEDHSLILALHAAIKSTLKDWEIPGCAVAVIKDQEILFQEGFGVKQLGSLAPVNTSTRFLLGPCTRTFTATALMLLVDRGSLKLDDKVQKYLPTFELSDPWVSQELTVRDVLTQRIGFTSSQGKLLWKWGYERQDLLFHLRYLKPELPFRTGFSESSLNYVLQSQLLTAVTGYQWETFIEKYILSPLNLRQTHVGIGAFNKTENSALPHFLFNKKLYPRTIPEIDSVAPAGLISASIGDLAQWALCCLQEGSLEGVHLLSPEVAREIFTPQVVLAADEAVRKQLFPELESDELLSYGIGWFLHTYHGSKVVTQLGTFPGMSAMITLVPEQKMGFVILANRENTFFLSALKMILFDCLLSGGDEKNWNAYLLQAYERQQEQQEQKERELLGLRKPEHKPSVALQEYCGLYFHPAYGELQVVEQQGQLKVRAGASAILGDLLPWYGDAFRVQWHSLLLRRPDLLHFALDADGKVCELTIESVGSFRKLLS